MSRRTTVRHGIQLQNLNDDDEGDWRMGSVFVMGIVVNFSQARCNFQFIKCFAEEFFFLSLRV